MDDELRSRLGMEGATVFTHSIGRKEVRVEEFIFEDGDKRKLCWVRSDLNTMEIEGFANPIIWFKFTPGGPNNEHVARQMVQRKFEQYWASPRTIEQFSKGGTM